MAYINLSDTTEVLSLADVLSRFPTTIFPGDVALIDFAALGFAEVQEVAAPEIDETRQYAVLAGVELVDGVWSQIYSIHDLPADQIATALEDQWQQSYQHGKSVVDLLLNQKAQERDYDTIQSAVIRAAYAGPYQLEGAAYGAWMDACWQAFYSLTADAKFAGKGFPSDEEILAVMAELELPADAA